MGLVTDPNPQRGLNAASIWKDIAPELSELQSVPQFLEQNEPDSIDSLVVPEEWGDNWIEKYYWKWALTKILKFYSESAVSKYVVIGTRQDYEEVLRTWQN